MSQDHDPETNALPLRRDNDGAIMVIGVFMAAFLVGMLYYLLGIGQTMLFRGRMQDAADAVTFSAAVMNARGMNLMVLINMIMAILLAILIMIRGLQILLGVAIGIAIALCFFGVGCGLIGPLTNALVKVTELYQKLEPKIFKGCEILTKANRMIRDVWWFVAQADAVTTAMDDYKPPLTVGFVWPVYRQLPTQDGEFAQLCRRAAAIPGRLVAMMFTGIGISSSIANFIGDMLTGFFELAAATICGFSAPNPPISGSYGGVDLNEAANSRPMPQGPEGAACEGPPVNADACERNGTWMRESTPPPGAQSCDDAQSPEQCQVRLSQAATACNPSNSPRPSDIKFFEETSEWEYEVREGVLMRPNTPVSPPTSRMLTGSLPCGTGSGTSRFSPYSSGTCGQDREAMATEWFEGLPGDPRPNQTHRITIRRVTGIISCKVPRDPPQPNAGSQPSQAAGAGSCGNPDIAHQVIKQCIRSTGLGEQEFQLLGVGIADTAVLERFQTGNDRGLWIAAFGRQQTGPSMFTGMQELAMFSIAQAEFYWDMPADRRFFNNNPRQGPDEWMWEMGWRARMRRVSIPPFFGNSPCPRSGNCGAGQSANPSTSQVGAGEAQGNTERLQAIDMLLIH